MKLLFLLLLSGFVSFGQTVLNGSFEINNCSPFYCCDNLSNGAFNASMKDVVANGNASEVDIYGMSGCWYYPPPIDGDYFIALDVDGNNGNKRDEVNLKLNQSLVKGEKYVMSFWRSGSNGYSPSTPIDIGISDNVNVSGTLIHSSPAPSYGWVYDGFAFIAPNNGQYISVAASGDIDHRWTAVDNFQIAQSLPVNLLYFNAEIN